MEAISGKTVSTVDNNNNSRVLNILNAFQRKQYSEWIKNTSTEMSCITERVHGKFEFFYYVVEKWS